MPAADAARVLAERREVDVVLDRHRQPEAPLELRADGHALEAVGVLGQPHAAGPLLDDARDADHDGVDAVGRQAADGDEPVAHPGDGVEHLAGAGAVELDVLARADRAAEVRQRAAQEPRADVDAEDERGLRDGLEEHGPVAAAGPRLLGLADEPGVQQRLQRDRHRRLRDPRAARDLGARDRGRVADRVEDRALVEVLEERRLGGGRALGRGHRKEH